MRLLVRLLINAAALWVAAYFVPGIRVGGWQSLLAVAIVFGLVNALLRPVLKLLSCPVIFLTLGLFTLVLNALMLMLTGWFSRQLGIEFSVAGFGPAFVGALIVSIVSLILSWLVPDPERS